MAKKKILYIEDEVQLAQAVRIRLEHSDYEVFLAQDGREGLVKTCKYRPDLIILDVMMPKMDGYTYVHEMKKILGKSLPPIIVLTAKDKCQDLFVLEGIKDYMVKPFDHQELVDRIEGLLKDKEENGNGRKKNTDS